ncbi:hypothetical protein MAR621_01268 [Maribacter dokdonensis]|uniref:hypothetical protein n=1 Tax=Maribacter dokdonensis TaxID=320912 RepID=UPI001B09C618|nr:hypothetical protein [Maribacter dokdonensis]CAG2533561.1 hypothetical protein MAR621_01268 [Maribacter dokdonensis]
MVVSVNPEPHKNEFYTLLNSTIDVLNADAIKSPIEIEKLKGTKLENYAGGVMSELAIGTPFENSIKVIGGQKFPDIVAKKFYGIEVKTTTQNHWKTTGNSVLESTRVEDVERIFMLFGKLGKPIEFRCRAYEECLSEVVVTHSPRYLIDMNLEEGKTIFDKINMPYDTLRQKKNPIKPITDYYKSKLKPGQDLWWIQDTEQASNLVINIWNNLSLKEKQEIKNRAMVYFPEVFSNRGDKFARLAIWLVTREAVVCPNVRDLFTAGGKADYLIKNKTYKNIPRVFIKLFDNIDSILEILISTSAIELTEYWNKKTSEKNKIMDWIELVGVNSKSVQGAKHLDIKQMLTKFL